MHDEMVSISEAAELLGVVPETIRAWIHQGHLDAVRVGPTRYRVSKPDVLGMIRPVEYRNREGRQG